MVVWSREACDLGRARVVAMGGGRSDSGSLVVLCSGWPAMEILSRESVEGLTGRGFFGDIFSSFIPICMA